LQVGVFFAAIIAQALVFILFADDEHCLPLYNFIGCAAVLILAPVLQQTIFRNTEAPLGMKVLRSDGSPDYLFRPATVRIFSQAVLAARF